MLEYMIDDTRLRDIITKVEVTEHFVINCLPTTHKILILLGSHRSFNDTWTKKHLF